MSKQDLKPGTKQKVNFQEFKIIIIEDDDGVGNLIQVALQKEGFSTVLAETGEEALTVVQGEPNELSLVDYNLPDMTGKELIQKLINIHGSTPHFITLTGHGNEQVAVEMMKLGSYDYITKDKNFIPVLTKIVKHACEQIVNEKELKAAHYQLDKNLKLLKETGEMARVGGWEIDIDSKKPYWSDVTKNIHEVAEDYVPTLEEAINFFPGASKDQIKKAVEKAIQEGEKYDLELPFITAKGNKRWVQTIGKPEMKDGKYVRLHGTFQDITDRKSAEKKIKAAYNQLAASEQQLRASNQQLAANEQQLRAANQQLAANEQELRAGNEQLKTANQQLTGEKEKTQKLAFELQERLKEMNCLYSIAVITEKPGISLDEILQQSVKTIPSGWQYPDKISARIVLDGKEYTTDNFQKSESKISQTLNINEDNSGTIEVFLHDDSAQNKRLSFLEEEKQLLFLIADRLGKVISRKYTAEKLEQTTKLLAETEKTAMIGGWIVDAKALNQTWTEETFRIFEIDTTKGTPKVPQGHDFIDPEFRPEAEKAFRNAIEKGTSYNQEWIVTTAKGNKKWVQAVAKPVVENGKVIKVTGSFLDITERKKAEEERRKSNERFRIAQEMSPDGFTILEPVRDSKDRVIDFKWIYENEAIAKLNGTNPEEIVGKRLLDLFPGHRNTKLMKVYKQVAETGKSVTLEESYKGETITEETWFRLVIVPMGDDIAILTQDITERKKVEKELISAKEKAEESDRLKSAFLNNMSHEIRTPMNGILGFTKLLQNPDLTGDQQNQFIDIIQKSGNRMLNTMNDLIEFSRIETGQAKIELEPTDICHEIKMLCAVYQIEAEQKGLQLIHDKCLPDDKTRVLTDKTKFLSIATNLLNNALKYTGHGSVRIGCEKRDGNFSFYVKDTGIGIPKNRQQAIFNRFEQADIEDTRAFQGSGLGLAITKAYVEMLGGKIWVESEEGAGSAFYCTLPWNSEEQKNTNTENPDVATSTVKSGVKPKILIVEDDETSYQHLSFVLENHAREIIHARDGEQAVELCKQHPDIDLILLDIKMPVLNGYDALRLIRDFNKDVAIIAQTAHALSGDREKALAAGCDDYITKPISNKVLLHKIGKLKFN